MYTCIGAFFVPTKALCEWSEPARKGNWDAFRRGLLSVSRCCTFLRNDEVRAFEALSRWLSKRHQAPIPRGRFVEELHTTEAINTRDDFLLFACVGSCEAEVFQKKVESLAIGDEDLHAISEAEAERIPTAAMYRAYSFLKTFLQFARYQDDHQALMIFD